MKTVYRYLPPLILVLLLLSSCAPQAEATLVPTVAVDSQPAEPTKPAPTTPPAGEATAYPIAEPLIMEDLPYPYPYPVDGGPSGVPARPNLSEIEARLVEIAPSDQDGVVTRVRALVLDARLIDGGDFSTALVNQEVDLFVQNQEIPALNPGDTFKAEISYMGDENGGQFYITRFLTE